MTLLPAAPELRRPDLRDGHYYQGYGPGTAQHWAAFRAAMNAFPVDADGRSHIVQAALDLFDRMAGLYAALYPSRRRTASSRPPCSIPKPATIRCPDQGHAGGGGRSREVP